MLNFILTCAVTLARNGRQALEALQSPEGEHINLILTDVLMPEVSFLSSIVVRLRHTQSLHEQVASPSIASCFSDSGAGRVLLVQKKLLTQC